MELKLIKKIPLKLKSSVTALALSDDEKLLVVGQESENQADPNITIWSTANFRLQNAFTTSSYTVVKDLILIAELNSVIYPTNSEIILQSIDNSDLRSILFSTTNVSKINYDKRSNSIIISGDDVIEIPINDILKLKTIIKRDDYLVDEVYPTPPLVNKIDDKYIILGDVFPSVINANNIPVFEIEKPPRYATKLNFDYTNQIIAAIEYPSYKLHLWNEKGKRILFDEITNTEYTFTQFCFLPGSNVIATGNKLGYIRLFNLENGEGIAKVQFQKRHIRSLVATKDNRIFSGSDDCSLIYIELK